MPRTARLDAPDLLQHVIVRGVERCDIFGDDNDRSRFVGNLSGLLVKTGTECLAWALMSNHFHLLLRPRSTPLATIMRRLLTGYAIYFNLRHNRSGHLFQNRYKSIVCQEDAYLLELVRYIHLNPLRAGLVKDLAALDNYPWSGHMVIMGKGIMEGQITDEILALFGKRKRKARAKYRQFIADGIAMGKRAELGGGRKMTKSALEELGEEPYDARVLGSGDFIRELQQRRELVADLPRTVEIGEIVTGVCHHFGIDAEILRRNNRSATIAVARGVICYLAVRRAGHSGVEVGKLLNLQRAGVSVAAERGEKMVQSNPKLLALIDE
ncbi:transposase [Geobacter sp.]|uniref:transposase n=1 Tax=Geobacter sp. TaxID=46610 RepID=UPI00260A04B0|nr:transposase [Geobacter sp.]